MISSLLTVNFTPYRHVPKPLAIVVHVTGADNAESTLTWFANPAAKVSAHYLVDKDGSRIWQLVPDGFTAWHSGITWAAMQALRLARPDLTWLNSGVNPNDLTIGIEHVGLADTKWLEEQMRASAGLIKSLCDKYQIAIDRQHIVGHHEIFAGHACPGECDIERLVQMAREAPTT